MILRDEFCPELEDTIVFPTSPVPSEREEQADGVLKEADNRPATPEVGNNDIFTVNEDAELLVPFHGWDQFDSAQPPAVQSLPLGKEVNEEPLPLPRPRIERNRRVTKVPKTVDRGKIGRFNSYFCFSCNTGHDKALQPYPIRVGKKALKSKRF
jgi:hypothetical protein